MKGIFFMISESYYAIKFLFLRVLADKGGPACPQRQACSTAMADLVIKDNNGEISSVKGRGCKEGDK